MAYIHFMEDRTLVTSGGTTIYAVNATTVVPKFHPGYMSYVVRAVAIVQVSTHIIGATNPVFTFRKRPTPGASGSQATIGTITLASGATQQGKSWYKAVTPVEINPGQEVDVAVSTAATLAARVKAMIFVEPRWRTPGELSSMKLSS